MLTIVVLGIRFLLEVVTVLGLLSGVFIKKTLISKLLFLFLGNAIVAVWSRYGAPKAPHAFSGRNKLLLEVLVYGIGIAGFYSLFGVRVGSIYAVIAAADLFMMYALNLQGH